MALKGFITFYVNYFPDLGQNPQEMLDLWKSYNKETIEKIRAADYEVMFLATTKEASRVEKIDLDKPFPKYIRGQGIVRDDEEYTED